MNKLKTKQPTECHDASTQTENLEPPPDSLDVSKSASLWNVGQTGHEVSNQSLAEQVKQVAENAQQQTGFVYEETSGMYYDYNTGYYYNAELGLYYDGNSGSYYYYDDKSKTFQFHSQAKVAVQPSWRQPAETPKSQHVAEAWPPCMRIIVEETGLDNLKVGSLSIVTCTGGTLGREKEHAVHIPDINISKHHAKFTFDEAQGKYFIVDFGSRNGTYLNGDRLSVALRESDPHEVSHGSILQLGSTKLLCHIHMGRETCKQCEPGLVQGTKEVTAGD
uniref:FHA domain-containing protein n=1 Tax=Timema douglasi TaxID=61478 RepID=A0A7R8VG58_TIMDO|nr:unnamed protein product [Timema douglasi]